MKAITLCTMLAVCVHAAAAERPGPRAVEIAKTMMRAMGGEQAWNAARLVRFDFKVTMGGKSMAERSHLWDRRTGKYRQEQKTKEGRQRVVLMNLGTKQGDVYVDGKKQDGPGAAKAIEETYAAYINDYYWLAMPWKWLDAGVNLKYLGPKTRGSDRFDLVELTFGKVGLTPGDRYDAYVSKASKLMTHWEFVLQSGRKGSWDWEYGDYGGVKLAKNHKNETGDSIDMGDVRLLETVDDAYFSNPARMLGGLK